MPLLQQQGNAVQRPQRTRGTPTDDGQFAAFEHVPIFDEHDGDDGVHYDERLLQAIAANCNRRIQTTGDWCPIVVAHTRDQDEKQSVNDDPPVVGLAGPFYVADFVNGQGQTVKAIHTTFWIFREDEKEFLKNPRRSVEIWPEDKPENRYFDPISVLGAETPKRDLGLIYSRKRPGCVPKRHCCPGPFRYSKRSVVNSLRYQESGGSVPGGNNTFIPGTQKQKHAKGASTMALSPDDLNQIVQAITPVIQAKFDELMGGMGGGGLPPIDDAGGDLGAGGPPPDIAGGAPPPAGGGLDAPGGAPGLDAPGGPPGLDAAGGPPPEMPPDDDTPSPDQMDDDSKLYAKGLGRKFGKYAKAGGFDDKGADAFMGSLDDDDKKHLGSYMKYMCDDTDTKEKYSQRYGKCPIGGKDVSDTSGSMAAGEMKSGEPQKYARGAGAQQYAKMVKDRNDAVIRYNKLHAEHEALKIKYAKADDELGRLRVKERYAKRYAELTELSIHFAFDPEQECADTDDFNDVQFDRHITQIIPQRYAKVSGGYVVPNERAPELRRGDDDKAQQYAKQASDVVQKYRKANRNVKYRDVLNHLVENKGQVNEDVLFAAKTAGTNGNGKH